MIVGTFLRYIKTYSGINYIPLSNGHSYCGIVGNNGIGKSSVLEALDSVINGTQPNFNINTRKQGASAKPHIVPLYLVKHDVVSEHNIQHAQILSDFVWNCDEGDILSQNRVHFKHFKDQRELLIRDGFKSTHLLLPLGLTFNQDGTVPSLSIFNTRTLGEKLIVDFDKQNQQIQEEDMKQIVDSLQKELRSLYEYIYIPKDIDPDDFTQLETKQIQSLMGETLDEIVEGCVPQPKIKDINDSLHTFTDKLSNTLGEYAFRTSGERQTNLRKNDVYKLIIV